MLPFRSVLEGGGGQKHLERARVNRIRPGLLACGSTGGGADSATLNFTPLDNFNGDET